MPRRSLAVGLVLALVVVACGSDESTETTTTTTATAVPGNDTTDPIDVPSPGEPWDVLFLGFDDVFTRAVGEQYGEALAEELGVDVAVFEPVGFDHVFAALLVDQLSGAGYPRLDEQVPPAEVIVLLSRPGEADDGVDDHISNDFEACWWRPTTGVAPTEDMADDYWLVYRDLLGVVFDELWDLRQDTSTAIVVLDMYNPSLSGQREGGIEDACVAWFEAWHDVIADVAMQNGATLVSLMDAFNGPDHRTDPTDLGLIGPTDEDSSAPWYRLTPAGVDLMLEALLGAGVEPTTAPG